MKFDFTSLLVLSLVFFLGAGSPCMSKNTDALPGLDMVRIPGGEFIMGSDSGAPDERPAHRVRVDSFYLSRTEVTVGQWKVFARDSGYITQAEKNQGGLVRIDKSLKIKPDANWKNPYLAQSDNHPVVLVSWYDARAFCRWLSKKTSLVYRLPTEAEWEYACRADSTGDYYGNLDSIAWFEDNSNAATHPVGSKLPNAFGLFDMLGNVWEWCLDRYDKDYYRISPGANPPGPSFGVHRVSRGGSWCSKPSRVRAAFRRHDHPDFRFYRLGFRVARSAATRGAFFEKTAPLDPLQKLLIRVL